MTHPQSLWRPPAVPLARPFVEFALDMGDLFVTNGTEIGAFGEVVSNQPVCVLVSAPLPGVVGMGEETFDSGSLFNRPPVSVLRPVVEGNCLLRARGYNCESLCNRRPCC